MQLVLFARVPWCSMLGPAVSVQAERLPATRAKARNRVRREDFDMLPPCGGWVMRYGMEGRMARPPAGPRAGTRQDRARMRQPTILALLAPSRWARLQAVRDTGFALEAETSWPRAFARVRSGGRSEEHTSELQSPI